MVTPRRIAMNSDFVVDKMAVSGQSRTGSTDESRVETETSSTKGTASLFQGGSCELFEGGLGI
jgi:hypothetical protein